MISTLDSISLLDTFDTKLQASSLNALENGALIYFPKLAFPIEYNEEMFLTENILASNAKNINLDLHHKLRGSSVQDENHKVLRNLLLRFKNQSLQFIQNLLPYYKNNLIIGRTSFRPAEILGRQTSIRKDDTRLHVDAFPATPNQGKRILRVFTNINHEERNRIWNLGEPFERVVQQFINTFRKPILGYRKLLMMLKITKSYRTLYDHYMLQLHDNMKCDDNYQKKVKKIEMHFPAGSSWVVMTDSVSHAALTGQHMLEQTFYLPPEAMQNPELSPLRVLERYMGQKLR